MVPKKKLSWGILGTAKINRSLIPALNLSKNSALTAIASRSLDVASHFAKEWRIPRAYGSYQELIDDPEIDVIYNPLPNHLHAEWSIRAARAGKHVLCEKPIALNPEKLDEIKNAAIENHVFITEAFMYRHHPQTIKVLEMVHSGVLGTVKMLRGSFSFILDRENDPRWYQETGGGSLWDVGCYPVSYAVLIHGKPPIEAVSYYSTTQDGAILSLAGQMLFEEDCYAQMDCSFELPLHTSMVIRGTKGTLTIPEPFKIGNHSTIYYQPNGNPVSELHFSTKHLYLGEIEDLENAILNKIPPRLSLEESKCITAALLKLLKSNPLL